MRGIHTREEFAEAVIAPVPDDVRLELIGMVPVREFMPSPRHQVAVEEVRATIRPVPESGCACFLLPDTFLKFPDGSLRRPDLMIFHERPAESSGSALREVPGAVVEILSPGGEVKDLHLGPAHYLAQGVLDVVVIDPEAGRWVHFRRDGVRHGWSGATLTLEMGCTLVT